MDSKERKKSNIYGWYSESEVAYEIYGSQFRDLLEGNLVFAYKNEGTTGTVKLLVVTKTPRGFRLGMLPQGGGWTYYNPCCPLEYLRDIIVQDLIKNKTEKFIIEDYLEYINLYGKN